jgi:ABC-type uncharacterized transport system fused permease/ATPase subunit
VEAAADLVPICAGQRVLIARENGEEKALVFRAVGGLWPWATDRSRARLVHPLCSCRFAPTPRLAPYATRSRTRARPPNTIQRNIAKALADVGLEHLQRELDVEERWSATDE